MGIITAWAVQYGLITAGTTIAVLIGGWILKKIPFDRFANWAEGIGMEQGSVITLFFNSKLPKLWNTVIEPIFVDVINAIFFSWIRGFIAGLKSDNPEE